jgi:hypothetical protein
LETELKIGSIENVRKSIVLLAIIGQEIVEALHDVQSADKRLRVFRLSVLRAVRICQAALLLDAHGFVEEVLALSRTLAEVVVNGCYLQISDDRELESFLAFDIQKSYKTSETLEEFIEPEGLISEERRGELQAIVATARGKSKKKDTDKSWTKQSVYQMAQKLDATLAPTTFLFTHVKATTYQFANPYVHGTFGSFGAVRRWLAEGTFPADDGRAVERFQAVEGIYQCLFTVCVYGNERFQLPFRQKLWDARLLYERD